MDNNENDETKDSSVKLSDETLAKFAEVKTLVDDAEESELIALQDEKDKAERPMDVRKNDEGLNEDGEVVGLSEEEEKAKAEEEERAKAEEEEVKKEESEAAEEKAEEEKDEGKQEKPTELTLPNRLIQAGYRNDMTDDDILALGDRAEAVLSKMADNTDKVSTILGERGRQVKVSAEEKKPEPLKFGTEDEDLVGKETLGKIETSHAGLDKRIAGLEEDAAKRQRDYVDSTVDNFFDGRAEEYPEFGKAATLTDIELIKRRQIADKAFDIQVGAQFYGRPLALPSALEQAFSIYETDNVKQKERTKLVSKVETRSKQITIRPTKRKTEQKFSSGREKAMDSYKKEMARIGQTVSDDDED